MTFIIQYKNQYIKVKANEIKEVIIIENQDTTYKYKY